MNISRNGRPISAVGLGLACWPREWEPDMGPRPDLRDRAGMTPTFLGDTVASTKVQPGQTVQVGQTIASPNGRAQLTMQSDGNLVLYDGNGHNSLWASDTAGKGGQVATVQPDGNFVVSDAQGKPLWASGTSGQPGAYLAVQDDGNLVVYSGTNAAWHTDTDGFTHHTHGGFDLGTALGQAWEGVKSGIKDVGAVADALHIPGANLYTAILTGGNLGDALKADVTGFTSAAGIATAVATGNPSAIAASLAPNLTNAAAGLGIHLNPSDVSAAVSAAQSVGDPSKIDPSKIAMTAMGSAGNDAWNVATNFGAVAVPGLPAPPGLSYQPGASTAAAANHPLTIAAKKKITLHLGKTSAPAKVIAYGPYPPALTAASSAPTGTAGVGRGGGGHGGGGHGGGGWHGGGGRPAFRGRGGGRAGWGWGGGGPWWPYVVVAPYEVACASWGDPVACPAEVAAAASSTIAGVGGRPVAVRGADGDLYLLSPEWVGGVLAPTVRPCAGVTGVGDANNDVLKAMALDLLGSLQRSVPQGATRSVMNFAQAWNAASADSQVATDGKYTQEIEGALDAALGALSPGSGSAPTAVL